MADDHRGPWLARLEPELVPAGHSESGTSSVPSGFNPTDDQHRPRPPAAHATPTSSREPRRTTPTGAMRATTCCAARAAETTSSRAVAPIWSSRAVGRQRARRARRRPRSGRPRRRPVLGRRTRGLRARRARRRPPQLRYRQRHRHRAPPGRKGRLGRLRLRR